MKKITIIISAIILLSGGLYLWNQTQKPSKVSNDKELVNIGYSRLRISLPVFVAEEQGIFKKNGINSKLVMYETAQPLMQSLIEGKIDVAGYTALPITFNGMLRGDKDLYFISTMIEDEDHRISYLLKAKGNKNINKILDLKGKTIGILPTIAYKAWIEEILRTNGVSIDEVQIQQVAPMQQGQALKSGAVDVLFTNDPVATSAIDFGIAELVSETVESPEYISNPFPFGSFNVSKKWADDNPKTYQALVKSIDEAIVYINNHPKEAKGSMKEYLPAIFQDHITKYPDAKYLTSSESTEELYEDVAKLYLDIGIIPSEIPMKGLVK